VQARMTEDKRKGKHSVPDDLSEVLNEDQVLMLKKMEEFGWKLEFIRKPIFQDVVPVLIHPEKNTVAPLESDGTLNIHADFIIRESE
jgi:hypothetical protein